LFESFSGQQRFYKRRISGLGVSKNQQGWAVMMSLSLAVKYRKLSACSLNNVAFTP